MTEDNRSEVAPRKKEPALVVGFIMKAPGKDAVVRGVEWHEGPGGRPTRADLIASFEAFLADWYHHPWAIHPDGKVKNVGDLIGELMFALPSLPGGTGHKVALDLHGEAFPIDGLRFDPYMPPTEEYDGEGTDMVLLETRRD